MSMHECCSESSSVENTGTSGVLPKVFACFFSLTSCLHVSSSDNNSNTPSGVHDRLTVLDSSQTICRNEESQGSLQDPLDTIERKKIDDEQTIFKLH
jgi:hypothetical protein